eukprot:SAG25_NODE_8512_length_418_cov_0.645768_1_plen_50_part_01
MHGNTSTTQPHMPVPLSQQRLYFEMLRGLTFMCHPQAVLLEAKLQFWVAG